MEKIRNYNQESEEEILENKQETLSEKESRLENIEIEQFEGEKLEAPKNYFQYLQEMSPIIKAIEASLSKNKSEVPNKPAGYFEYLNNINTELMDISRDLFDQTQNLDKYRNKEASFKDMLELSESKDNLFFLKGIDREKAMDFLGATTHLDKEERNRLIESLKYVKVFQEFKEKTQNIIEQIIDKIDNLVRQYKEITTESTGESTAWDTYELQTNRKSLEYDIKEKIANLQAVKIGLMSEFGLDLRSIDMENLDSRITKTYEDDPMDLDSWAIEQRCKSQNLSINFINNASNNNIINNIYKNTLESGKNPFKYNYNIECNEESLSSLVIFFENNLKDKYGEIPLEEVNNEIIESLIKNITEYIKLTKLDNNKNDLIDDKFIEYLLTFKDKVIEDTNNNYFSQGYIRLMINILSKHNPEYKKNFIKENEDKIKQRLKNKLENIEEKYLFNDFKEEMAYWDEIQPNYRKEFFINNKDKISHNIKESLIKESLRQHSDLLIEQLDYWDSIYKGYREMFFQENKEEINEIISISYTYKVMGVKVYKLVEKIGFKDYNTENSFVGKLVKKHNGLENDLIRGYSECKEKGIIKEENYEEILELVNRLPVLNEVIVKEYLEAKNNQKEIEYLDRITETMDKITRGGITEEERNEEYFQDILEYTYPNNAGSYGNYESVKRCKDRSEDLEGFKLKEKYPINIIDKSKLELREGRELNKENLGKIEKEQNDIMREYEEGGTERIKQSLTKIIEEIIAKIGEDNKLGIQVEKLISQEDKIYAGILYSRLNKEIKEEEIKKSILYYNFSHLDNIERYQEDGGEGIEKYYEKIMGLSEFYKDTIKEAQNIIVDKAKYNPIFQEITENIYKENQERERIAREKQELGKLQIDKLGLNDKFIKDMRNILIKRRLNKDSSKEERARIEDKYSEDRIREIISRYESMTRFLEDKSSNSKDSNTKTFYGRLKGQRNKTIEAFTKLTGEERDLITTHLGDINLKEVIDLKISTESGIYDEELFNKLIEQSVTNLYKEENDILELEANKFVMVDYDKDGKKIEKKPKKLNGYINKDDLSAYARGVGGVCVSGCNPDKGEKNMWDMPNYFQLVLQNPENKRCVGLVLLHHFEDENGQKILSASYNPSSTYLYSVDQASLFNELNNSLIEFSKDNDFDKIVISKDRNIRTNRTRTDFEKSMDKAINKYKEFNAEEGNYSFSESKDFSYYPSNYKLDNMDVIWSK